jgi:hypothetical protein
MQESELRHRPSITEEAEEKHENASQNIRCPGRDPKGTSARKLENLIR